MSVVIIAAVTENYGLGANGDLLHKCPTDLEHFKYITKGSTLIMGRKTYESLPSSKLPYREIIVVGSGEGMIPSLKEALEYAKKGSEESTIFIAGGANIYKEALESGLASAVYLTTFSFISNETDTWFPVAALKSYTQHKVTIKSYRTYIAPHLNVQAKIEVILLEDKV